MARAQSTDYLQNFRFHVVSDPASLIGYNITGVGEAGFNTVTTPEMTLEAAEYREGTFRYTRKYPGPPTFSEMTLSRGVTREDTKFFDWTNTAGTQGDYRSDLTVHHFHRDEEPSASSPAAQRRMLCYECLPIRSKSKMV